VEWAALDKYLENGKLKMQFAGQNSNVYYYGLQYGSFECKAWDATEQPYCANADGTLKNYAPQWCSQKWCYVNKNDCTLPMVYKSSYFPDEDLWYSYSTCGSQNTFSSWASAGGLTDGGIAESKLIELVDLIDGYSKSSRDTIEKEVRESAVASSGCSLTSGCSCPSCRVPQDNYWGTQQCDFTDIMVLSHGSEWDCIAKIIKDTYLKVAGLEYDDISRIGYQYAGQQADGSYAQWPAMAWCPSNYHVGGDKGVPGYDSGVYDPRFRDWYAGAASGPKDVVLVLDTSGSMSAAGRLGLMKAAAQKVLKTLTWVDFVSVVLFSTQPTVKSTALLPATKEWIATLDAFISGCTAEGSTNFRDALSVALDLFRNSRSSACTSSGCNAALLFLSDGKPDSWSAGDNNRIAAQTSDGYITFFTFGLGSGAEMGPLIQIAKHGSGKGYATHVADGGAIGDAMSSYYITFSDSSEHFGITQRLRWVTYADWITGSELLAGCMPFFNQKGSSATSSSTSSNASGNGSRRLGASSPPLLGVTCMDINMVVDLKTLKKQAFYSSFEAAYRADSRKCANGKTPPGGGDVSHSTCQIIWSSSMAVANRAHLTAPLMSRVLAIVLVAVTMGAATL
jgi:uncharacterized protein YegL